MFSTLTRKMPCTEKFLKWMLPRGLLVILALVVCLVVIGNVPWIETGIVEYKLVTGKNDKTSHILIITVNGKNIVVAEKMKDIANSIYKEDYIDQALEDEMTKYYTDIQYNIALRLTGNNAFKSFIIPRDVFNAAGTNSKVKFEIERPYSNKVTRMIKDDNPIASTTHYLPVIENRHFLNQ